MSTAGVRRGLRISKGTIVVVLILALLIGYAIYMSLGGGRGGQGGGGTTTTITGTSTGTSAPSNVLYPNAGIVNGYDLILIEDHVAVIDGQYSIVASAVGAYRSVVAYGGTTVSGNITYGTAVIKYGGYEIPVVGFASTNSTLVQDFPGIQVRLDVNGGYVLYEPIKMAVYYRHYQYNISNTVVHVWAPAKTQPSTLASASVHVTIDPEYGVYYINGVAYGLDMVTPPKQYKGILRSWLVYTGQGGKYAFTINP
jgi:hypothetical protein